MRAVTPPIMVPVWLGRYCVVKVGFTGAIIGSKI